MIPRIGVVDVETLPATVLTFSLFKPMIGIEQVMEPSRLAGFGWKWIDQKKVDWFSEFDMGREGMLNKAYELMDEADIIVHFNGVSFDEPWLQGEFKSIGLKPPSPTKQVDLMRAVKKRFRYDSNRLDFVVQKFGLGKKMSTGGFSLWRRCVEGSPEAWARMGRYCKQDVLVTEKLYHDMLPWLPKHPHLALYDEANDEDSCPRCGSLDLQRRGFSYTDVSKFQQYRCNACGGWSRGKTSLQSVNLRGVAV